MFVIAGLTLPAMFCTLACDSRVTSPQGTVFENAAFETPQIGARS